MFPLPAVIEASEFARLPDEFRRQNQPTQWASARRRGLPIHSFLEGPAFDRDGNLYVTDIPFGRVFRISPEGRVTLIAEYDGEPNGLKIHKDGRIFITDFKNGIMELDASRGTLRSVLGRRYTERFKGVNDLFFASNGDMYFTDQGRTGHQDATGGVYLLTAEGSLRRLFSQGIGPNGLVLNLEESTLYVAMSAANAVWHLPLMSTHGMTEVTSVGTSIQLSGGFGPDGIGMTADGGLAVVHFGMGAVWIFDAIGQPLYRVKSCGSNLVTNLTFGGSDMKKLFFTDAGDGIVQVAELPIAGNPLFSHQ
jgi:gluconolactonase